ncbi:hypothetical protein [Amycolatopsis anabasis]|uniref:hypothetical protein n=1 Tax=Amycolatopsis anabasis TaxID=1840409 RepID=UPI00131CEB61|nr:hypothetical protein [Amycolatopsis anabasis]
MPEISFFIVRGDEETLLSVREALRESGGLRDEVDVTLQRGLDEGLDDDWALDETELVLKVVAGSQRVAGKFASWLIARLKLREPDPLRRPIVYTRSGEAVDRYSLRIAREQERLLADLGETDQFSHVPASALPAVTAPSRTVFDEEELDVPDFLKVDATRLSRNVGRSTRPEVPVTIYLADGAAHDQVEAAVQDVLAAAGLAIISRGDPVLGSWFRRLKAGTREAARSPLGREALAVGTHAVESRLVLEKDAEITATLLSNIAPVINALQAEQNAVIRLGAVLVVKVDGNLMVHQLTPAQQLTLNHTPQLLKSPREILAALEPGPADAPRLDPEGE